MNCYNWSNDDKINEIYKNRENPNNVDSYKSSLKAIVGDSKIHINIY